MLLQKTVELINGVATIENAIWEVKYFVFNKLEKKVHVTFNIYKNIQALEFQASIADNVIESPKPNYDILGEDFDKYFSETILIKTGVTIEKQIAKYFKENLGFEIL